MSGHLILLDKNPVVHPVGEGETWRQSFARCVLRVIEPEANSACQYDPICAILKAGIDGTVHGFQAIWDTKLNMEYWGFLFVDAKNALNNINQIEMLWKVRHLWQHRYCFIFTF